MRLGGRFANVPSEPSDNDNVPGTTAPGWRRAGGRVQSKEAEVKLRTRRLNAGKQPNRIGSHEIGDPDMRGARKRVAGKSRTTRTRTRRIPRRIRRWSRPRVVTRSGLGVCSDWILLRCRGGEQFDASGFYINPLNQDASEMSWSGISIQRCSRSIQLALHRSISRLDLNACRSDAGV